MLCYFALFKDLFEKEGKALGLRITASALGEDGETFALSSQDSEVILPVVPALKPKTSHCYRLM